MGRSAKEWDGVIRHITPGMNGYRRFRCRCDQGCAEAGERYRERERGRISKKRGNLRWQAKNSAAAAERPSPARTDFTHGASGWRYHGCRCEECILGHADELERKRVVPVEDPVDWSVVEQVKPGYGVRRRGS